MGIDPSGAIRRLRTNQRDSTSVSRPGKCREIVEGPLDVAPAAVSGADQREGGGGARRPYREDAEELARRRGSAAGVEAQGVWDRGDRLGRTAAVEGADANHIFALTGDDIRHRPHGLGLDY